MKSVRQKKSRVGVVVSDKMQKTRVVAVDRVVLHPVFKKYYRLTSKFKVHDERNESHLGDKVEIMESRPLSKTKRWTLKIILRKAAA